jgi:hypothetical protein
VSFDAKAGFVGLVTATSEAGGAPSGLRVADNVVLRREGALMPRPIYTSSALSRTYLAAFPYRGQMWFVTATGIYNPAQTLLAEYLVGGSPSLVRADVQGAREARGNMYFGTQQGVYKVTGAGSTALYQAGIRATENFFTTLNQITTGTDHILTTGAQVAYRGVSVRTDVNGVITRSRPTGAITVVGTAANSSPELVIYQSSLPDPNAVSRVYEIYRTRVFTAGSQVDDEMQLVQTVQLPSGGGIVTVVDKVPDTKRGTTLYTSPSRGGIENANDRPPGAACIERYRSSLFFGNTVGPHRVTFSYKWQGTRSGQATGIGQRVTTGTVTNGSNVFTSVASTVGVQVGMLAYTSLGGVAPGKVTAVTANTVTVQNNASIGGAGATLYFNDALTIDNGAAFGYGAVAPPYGVNWNNPSTSMGLVFNVGGTSYTGYEITPPVAGYDQTVVIERIARGGTAFQLRGSHGDEVNPAVPLGDAATGLSSTADVFPHGLAWSEPDEPEHVPPKNFARVGDAGKAILGLVATRDRLLIFKEDGLYMLTGNTARDFGIYPLDTTCLCILPGSIRRLKNTVFLLTNLGLCAVDENGGVAVISRPIQLEVAAIVNAIRASQKATGLYNMPGLSGVTGAGDDAQGEYHLALGSSTPSFGGQVLVYSIPRDGFTTFSFGTPAPVALSTDGEGNPLVLTASTLLTPTTTLGPVTARVSPRGFTDPALLGKLWTHIAASFSKLTGTTSIQAKFTSSEPQLASAETTETLEAPTLAGLVELPNGSLLRHPLPRAIARAHMLFVELVIAVSNGTFTLEVIAAESRENASNKRPSHGSGAT